MTNGPSLTITLYFHRNDGRRERVAFTHHTLTEAFEAVTRVFYMSGKLYNSAEIYRGDQLVDTVENTSSLRLTSILLQ